uniref:Uncharacterized protein n=1 Tax=Plectus sambesii TaxID=2011161 RepID=A0A914URB8_9BILA
MIVVDQCANWPDAPPLIGRNDPRFCLSSRPIPSSPTPVANRTRPPLVPAPRAAAAAARTIKGMLRADVNRHESSRPSAATVDGDAVVHSEEGGKRCVPEWSTRVHSPSPAVLRSSPRGRWRLLVNQEETGSDGVVVDCALGPNPARPAVSVKTPFS